jgi:hypothetical protein
MKAGCWLNLSGISDHRYALRVLVVTSGGLYAAGICGSDDTRAAPSGREKILWIRFDDSGRSLAGYSS